MSIICPSVTSNDGHIYRAQIERVTPFAKRIHVDISDGVFAPKLMEINQLWWPENIPVDIHVMSKDPAKDLKSIIALVPSLVIMHAEADGKFFSIAEDLHNCNIKVGVALLATTPVSKIAPSIEHIDHVLIFSGDLGHFGGTADLNLLSKVGEIRALKKDVEIGWDGGVNDQNAARLAGGGIDVLNVGGFIQTNLNAQGAYATLDALVRGVV